MAFITTKENVYSNIYRYMTDMKMVIIILLHKHTFSLFDVCLSVKYFSFIIFSQEYYFFIYSYFHLKITTCSRKGLEWIFLLLYTIPNILHTTKSKLNLKRICEVLCIDFCQHLP